MTGIPYCDEVWNVTAGCTKCAPGCENCWAEKWANRLIAMGQEKYYSVMDGTIDRPYGWNGEIYLDESILDKPLHWRKPRRIFVCSMSDLFHPKVPDKFIGDVFEVIRRTSRHNYLIFTKRIERMKDVAVLLTAAHGAKYFKHVQWILSLSTQKEADEKIPILLQIPAAVRGLSLEPLLGPILLDEWIWGNRCPDPQCDDSTWDHYCQLGEQFIHWVIVGCESGPKRRPCRIEWMRSIVQQCKAANLPVYVKQLSIKGKVSRNPLEWPEDLRVQQYPSSEGK